LAIFKTWQEWTSTHQGTMFRMDCMWYLITAWYIQVLPRSWV
jgi:hypothetical protein